MSTFARSIRPHVDAELRAADEAEARDDASSAFTHLERAHVLGQAATVEHVRVHWRMLLWGLRRRDVRECLGQVVRLCGAATKTAFGLVPHGNTGGANVSPIAPMPIPPDLDARIREARAAAD
ncbi:MAG: DUF3703 domain-containing protein [Deltaproteobacteria bacterium]|jgi:hypothetical protein|nr:DUF3703 domain-containing protein [Deltaproteobacteria bacterium]MBK8694929.1 DUF3703 domain-containing protein [Deltaproteobacteria bacterium]